MRICIQNCIISPSDLINKLLISALNDDYLKYMALHVIKHMMSKRINNEGKGSTDPLWVIHWEQSASQKEGMLFCGFQLIDKRNNTFIHLAFNLKN